MTLTNLLVPTYSPMLRTLVGWLAKAEAQMPDKAEGMLLARLAPDMFPLSTQIRFACLQAQEAVYRLRGEAFPVSFEELVNEGRNAADHPGTIAGAKSRIEETLNLLNLLAPDALDGDDDRPVAHEIPNGMIFDLTAAQYARDWALPQFYFHLMAAYAILRSAGVALGKADYIPHMFPFIRPGTMPTG
ncbi:MAG: DUF1993 domain-containing protein [Sphingopyxis sp.]|nr:DUF1993 domain-containing protein [Sphingopyxis sp.]